MKGRNLFLTATLTLAACTDTGPISVGPDTYMIATRVPLGGPSEATGNAAKEASEFCATQGKRLLLQHTQSSECALHGGCGESQITFYCLSPDDPQFVRPRYQGDPQITIQR